MIFSDFYPDISELLKSRGYTQVKCDLWLLRIKHPEEINVYVDFRTKPPSEFSVYAYSVDSDTQVYSVPEVSRMSALLNAKLNPSPQTLF